MSHATPVLKTGRWWRHRWPWRTILAEQDGVILCRQVNDGDPCLRLRDHPGLHKDRWGRRWADSQRARQDRS